ncbi:RagB/SusD family nutrient uptake outer membrane protein [Chitinophaga sp. Ak27]|uniref:RagB/SusD family nutrient uptake outer membrane protein n=1 Tax=Chitinophaga sp. Ak27 TaxID=2726116 RepID=UPI00145C71BB|nr:RagB/SusD family nutrient uptake outer membrane protein [Chitinophaga sp. Ak27]NLU90893.1 RagB/SusD family nutrient uptake outer membrane protein [Chitinophaga sp. Ak27]
MITRYIIVLLAGFYATNLTACRTTGNRPSSVFNRDSIALMTSDSALVETRIEDSYEKILVPLYYDACTTDERTDNFYNPVPINRNDKWYINEYYQLDKIGMCRRMQNIIAENVSTGNINRNRWEAECLFLENMVYYYWVQRFGTLNLDTQVADSIFIPNPRQDALATTYRFIIHNFQRCATELPDSCSKQRASKFAALAMLTRVALQAAAYVPTERQAYLNLVMKSAKAVLQNKAYRIDPDYKELFNNSAKALFSNEVILGIYKSRTSTTFQQTLMQDLVINQSNEKMKPGYGPPLQESFDGWSKRYPTQDLTDAYLVIDNDGLAKQWRESAAYRGYEPGKSYISSTIYAHRDKRFYASIVYDSSAYFSSTAFIRDSGNFSINARMDGNLLSPTGYYVRKFLYETKKVWYIDGTDHYFPVLRLGEIWLNYAEALLLSNDKDAIAAINSTRTHHGGLPPLNGNTSLPLLWNAYKTERRVELFFENDRYWSLLRWARLNNQATVQELRNPVEAIHISADGKSFEITGILPPVNRNDFAFTSQLLLPLPPNPVNRK